MSSSSLDSETLLEHYFRHYAFRGADSLSPEIQVWNTKDLTEFWRFVQKFRGNPRADIPYWAVVWPGGRALARHILDYPSLVSGRRVLDVGTGSGIVAVAVAMAGGEVQGYDTDPDAVEIARRTARLNGVEARFQCRDPLAEEPPEGCDLILAGDIFYEEEFSRRSMEWLREAARRGISSLVADPGRHHRPEKGVEEVRTMQVPVYREIENISRRETKLLSVLS